MTDKRYNLDDLGAILGVGNTREIWKEVQANQKKLKDCPGPHDFVQEGEGVRRTYRCSKCDGTVDPIRYFWYLEGLKHGLVAKPEDIKVGFTQEDQEEIKSAFRMARVHVTSNKFEKENVDRLNQIEAKVLGLKMKRNRT